jgi:hypothetical protein
VLTRQAVTFLFIPGLSIEFIYFPFFKVNGCGIDGHSYDVRVYEKEIIIAIELLQDR